MFVPVVLALHDPQANNGVVHLAERLVIPLLGAGFHQGWNVHQVERRKLYIEVSGVRIILLFAHGLEMTNQGLRGVMLPRILGGTPIEARKSKTATPIVSQQEVRKSVRDPSTSLRMT